jgi:hypothetical protein
MTRWVHAEPLQVLLWLLVGAVGGYAVAVMLRSDA